MVAEIKYQGVVWQGRLKLRSREPVKPKRLSKPINVSSMV